MNSFVPIKLANLAIVDGRVEDKIINNLKNLDLEVIKTIKCNEVHESISYHPDIVIHPINHNTLIIAPNVYDYYNEALKGKGLKLIKGEKFLSEKYPDNIAYNVARLGNLAIHNFKHTDKLLKKYLEKEKLEFVNIKQAYSKCSLCIVNEDSAITSDYPMYKKLKDRAYDVLLIEPGHITLELQNYGFIGGSNGNLSKNKSVISGSLKDHPNKQEILKFFQKENVELKVLSDKKINDIGTIIILSCN